MTYNVFSGTLITAQSVSRRQMDDRVGQCPTWWPPCQ